MLNYIHVYKPVEVCFMSWSNYEHTCNGILYNIYDFGGPFFLFLSIQRPSTDISEYSSILRFTCPNDMWTGLCIHLWCICKKNLCINWRMVEIFQDK